LKTFKAASPSAALSEIREALGDDALILSTETASDGSVEMTAALDDPAVDQGMDIVPVDASGFVERSHNETDSLSDVLKWHGVPVECHPHALMSLTDYLNKTVALERLDQDAAGKILIFSGPVGSGKTMTVARVATEMVLRWAIQPLVVCMDSKRAGALEQLASYTRILGIPLVAAHDLATYHRALARRKPGQPVLVDTGALNVFSVEDRQFLMQLQNGTNAELVAVIPAALDFMETFDIAEVFRALDARSFVLTRWDQARRLGGMIAAGCAGLSLLGVGAEVGISRGLCTITIDEIARKMHKRFAAPLDLAAIRGETLTGRSKLDTIFEMVEDKILSTTFQVLSRHMLAQKAAREMASC